MGFPVFASAMFMIALGCRGGMPVGASSRLTDAPRLDGRASIEVTPGTYYGYVLASDGKAKWPLTGELLLRQNDKQSLRSALLLRISLGQFLSHEYQSDYFADVKISANGGLASAHDGAGGWSIAQGTRASPREISGRLSVKGGSSTLPFRIFAVQAHTEGQMAAALASAYPNAVVSSQVEGLYRGQCEDGDHELQLETQKWLAGTATSESILAGYSVTGRWGMRSRDFCKNGTRPCVRWEISEGRLDLSENRLSLKAGAKNWDCLRDGDSLQCASCRLHKVVQASARGSAEIGKQIDVTRTAADFDFKISGAQFADAQDISDVATDFFGYVYLEATGAYQFARLKLDVEKFAGTSTRASTTRLSGVATLFFGGAQSDEFIAYRIPAADQHGASMHPVLDASGDAVLQLGRWTNGGVSGIWYSKSAGRIGPFQFMKGKAPASKLVSGTKISGHYGQPSLGMALMASADVSESSFDFFPIAVRGAAYGMTPSMRHASVTGAAFDPFRGRFALRFSDRSTIDGRWTSEGPQIYSGSGAQFGAIMPEFRKSLARLTESRDAL